MTRLDVVVVGGGAAGLVAAAEAAKAGMSVAVLNKGQTGRSGATVTVSGDISVDARTIGRLLGLRGNEEDSEEAFFEDTIKGGWFLNHQGLARAMVSEIGAEVKALIDAGLKATGPVQTGGHRFPRGVWASGMQMLQILTKQAAAAGARFREEFYVTDLLTAANGVAGILGIDLRSGETHAIAAKAVVLASGGGMMIYPFQTAPEELVGDGYWLALQAGAELIDMEMVQFLPCCLVNPPIWRGIQLPWLIGPQSGTRAWLLNKHGERFMARYDPERMEMSTRDIISIACVREVAEGRGGPGGGVYMSWAHLPHNILDYLAQWYGKPHLRSNWHWEGFDFRPLIDEIKRGYAVEVAPASHFCMGGVAIDTHCATTVAGLYACGEVAGGLHGANRLSGNACSQFLVQGRQAGRSAADYARRADWQAVSASDVDSLRGAVETPLGRADGVAPHELKARVQDVANRHVGLLRSGKSLEQAVNEARRLRRDEVPRLVCGSKERRYNKQWQEAMEARSAVTALEAVALSGLRREESRGAHYRADFPTPDDDRFLWNGLLRRDGEELSHRTAAVDLGQLSPALSRTE